MVWVSRAIGHESNQRPFRNDVGERDHTHLIQIEQAIERGETLNADDFPREIFGAPHAHEADYALPNFFHAYGYWVVSKAAADVLGRFDLGNGGLYRVSVLRNDRVTPVGGEWFCFNFGNQKSALVPDMSDNIRQRAQGRYKASALVGDQDIVVSAKALEAPDVWVDTQMWDALFLSEALGNALKEAEADEGFFLLRCRVVSAE